VKETVIKTENKSNAGAAHQARIVERGAVALKRAFTKEEETYAG